MSEGARSSILMCVHRAVCPDTMHSILGLLRADSRWGLITRSGNALIAHARSEIVADWLRDTQDDVFLMVDDDIAFTTEDAQRAVSYVRSGRDIVCGAYPVRGTGKLCVRGLDDDEAVLFGPGQPLREVRYGGTGFMAVHRRVVQTMTQALQPCTAGDGHSFAPLFAPAAFAIGAVTPDASQGEQHPLFLSEDFAFCELARRFGFRLWLDPQAILTHMVMMGLTVHNMGPLQNDPEG